MNRVRALVTAGAAAVLGLATTAGSCDPPKKGPAPATFVVQIKRKPCGNDGVCQKGEVNCWQIQYKRVATGEIGFKCVTQKVWNGYHEGDSFNG